MVDPIGLGAIAMLQCSNRAGGLGASAKYGRVEEAKRCHSQKWRSTMIEFLRDQLSRWRTYNRIRYELSQHSHRELYDLRIGPADIDHIAWQGAYGSRG